MNNNINLLSESENSGKNLRLSSGAGFTLIEILLGITIIGIFATSTFVVFTRFNRQQNITIASKNVKNDLAEAKSNALSHVVDRCKDASEATATDVIGVLVGYQITFFNVDTDGVANNEYSLQEVCRLSSGVIQELPAIKTKKLPKNVSFVMGAGNTPDYIRFLTLSGGATFPGAGSSYDVKLNSSDSQIDSISVNSQGVIQ